jgi:hypothetical protein
MSIFNDITDLITGAPAHEGYAPAKAQLPYCVTRPLYIDPDSVALNGEALAWGNQYSVYCCGASVEASYNLAISVMKELQGAPVGGTTLSTSMGYSGAQVEGHYESQVTVQLNQGGI